MMAVLADEADTIERFDYMHPKIPSVRDFAIPPSALTVGYVDIDTNQLKLTNLREYIRSLHQSRTLVLWGEPNCCKTPVSWCIAACTTQLYRRADNSPCLIYDLTDVESLPRNELQRGDALVFQEFVPSSARGHNKAWTLDLLKVLLDPAVAGDLPGKGSNSRQTGIIRLPAGVPRICTTNKPPSVWLRCIPANLELLSSDELGALCADTKAILKRLAFINVSRPLLSPAAIAAFRQSNAIQIGAVYDSVFTGANAIP